MYLDKYPHKELTLKPNKYQITPIKMPFDMADTFNEIYKYCKEHFIEVKPTKAGAMPNNNSCKLHSRYMIIQSKNAFELTIVCYQGCYRFIFGADVDKEENPVSGKESVRTIYKVAKELNINLSKYAIDKETGKSVKETIHSPHIKQYCASGIVYTNVHHLDFHSSHWSRLIEKEPNLQPIAEYMYMRRKQKNKYYKHVLTNSYGCMQSEYCPDVNNAGKIAPYQFANLSKIMCDGTYYIVEEYVEKLIKSGRRPLLTNTDGIWYQGDLYHDENEGPNLCQWDNDHTDCKLLVKSKGAYQFEENNECTTVIRGKAKTLTKDWTLGEILKPGATLIDIWLFDKEKGVYKNVKEI